MLPLQSTFAVCLFQPLRILFSLLGSNLLSGPLILLHPIPLHSPFRLFYFVILPSIPLRGPLLLSMPAIGPVAFNLSRFLRSIWESLCPMFFRINSCTSSGIIGWVLHGWIPDTGCLWLSRRVWFRIIPRARMAGTLGSIFVARYLLIRGFWGGRCRSALFQVTA